METGRAIFAFNIWAALKFARPLVFKFFLEVDHMKKLPPLGESAKMGM
jgi:hypothetical protein